MRILFHSNHLGLLGTEVALFDYAYHCQTMLGHEAAIVYDRTSPHNDPLIAEKFGKLFPVYSYAAYAEVEPLAEKIGCERIYFIKSGVPDGKVTRSIPSLVHAVYPIEVRDFHGSVFAFVSEWLSKHVTQGATPFVPHMINLPEHEKDLRKALRIPESALVIGSYGAHDAFDVPFVPPVIRTVLERRPDIHFLFMNYPRAVAHPRAIYLPRNPDLDFKVAFINTSDAMLHARVYGETFGLACGEFSSRNRPIITFGGSPLRSHLEILGEQALVYNNEHRLFEILMTIGKDFIRANSWDCYSERFSPGAVMRKFNDVFLDPAL
jgi:hypothetical protein